LDRSTFESEVAADGYAVTVVEFAPNTVNGYHSHSWDVRALVVRGDITLTISSTAIRYVSGDQFTLAAGCEHHEVIGANGVEFLAGRRSPQAAVS
jgi:quercetin dioxygenase-like cupin family protein